MLVIPENNSRNSVSDQTLACDDSVYMSPGWVYDFNAEFNYDNNIK